jgi:hypothetical protein
MWARNRVGIGLAYRPSRLAESIPWNLFLKSLKVVGKGCCLLCVGLFGGEAAIVLCTDLLWGLYSSCIMIVGLLVWRCFYILCISTVDRCLPLFRM